MPMSVEGHVVVTTKFIDIDILLVTSLKLFEQIFVVLLAHVIAEDGKDKSVALNTRNGEQIIAKEQAWENLCLRNLVGREEGVKRGADAPFLFDLL